MRDQPILNNANKKANEPKLLVLIIKLITRMAVVHKVIILAVYKITIPTVCIKPTKAITSLLMNIKYTQSYRTFNNVTVYLAA